MGRLGKNSKTKILCILGIGLLFSACKTEEATVSGWKTPRGTYITTPAKMTKASSAVTISGNCEDNGPVRLSGAGLSTPMTADCIDRKFSANISFSTGEGDKVIEISQTDDDGELWSSSYTFVNDTIAPLLSYASPTPSTASPKGVTITGNCEDGLAVILSGDGLEEPAEAVCSGGSFSKNVIFSSGEGEKNIEITQMDEAGNTTSQERSFIKDSIAPTFTQASLPKNYFSNTNQVTWGGTCETGLAVKVTGADTTTTPCAAGTWSYTTNSQATDSSYGYQFSQTDEAGNATKASANWRRDTISPSVTITSPIAASYATESNYTALSVAGSCDENGTVVLGGAASGSYSCTAAGGFITTVNLAAQSDGPVSITAQITDAAGNTSAVANVAFNKDIASPLLTQATYSSGDWSNTDTVVFGGSCETGLTVNITGDDSNTATCAAGTWSYTTATQTTDATYNYTFTQTDLAGHVSTVNAQWKRDRTAPVVNSMEVNSGNYTLTNNNVLVTFNSTDTREDISAFCIKYNSLTTPSAGDSCWKTLASVGDTVTDNYTITDYPYAIGTIAGTYDLRVWVKDEANNISTQSDTVGVDKITLNYDPDPPPAISNVIASSTDSPSDPLTSADTTILIGSDIYVKWKIEDDNPIPAGNVSIYYSTDEENYTLLSGGLNNGVNGSCTISASESGCAQLSAASPTSTYYRVRVIVQDSGVSTVLANTNPLNTGSLNVLAGNTSLGIGGSASSALLMPYGIEQSSKTQDFQGFVVTKTGYVFLIYDQKGLAYVSPEDGLLKILMPDTGTSTGDGGNASAGTVKDVTMLALDQDENLLFWDHDQVRKIDLSSTPWQVSTLFGGGGDDSDGADAASADINYGGRHELFATMPNGRVYYEKGREIWYYDPTDSKVKRHLTLNGFGVGDMVSNTYSTYDWANCTNRDTALAFDKGTSAITKIMRQAYTNVSASCGTEPTSDQWHHTGSFDVATGTATAPHPPDVRWDSKMMTGKDGKVYVQVIYGTNLYKYDPGTNSLTNILGTGVRGYCDDGTLATSCNVTLNATFVNEFGKIYFMDRGVIRYIDDGGLVQSLLGQSRRYGIGSNPLSARFAYLRMFSVGGDNVFVKNRNDGQIVKFSLAGGVLEHIAGNGVIGAINHDDVATNSPIYNQWTFSTSLFYDSAANRLYDGSGYDNYSYIDLSTGQWVEDYEIQTDARTSYMAKSASGKILIHLDTHKGIDEAATIRELDPSTKTDTIIYGRESPYYQSADAPLDLCDGVDGLTCLLQGTITEDHVTTQYKYDSGTDNWLLAFYGNNYVNTIPVGGGTTNRFEPTVNGIRAFDYKTNWLYYCATNGKLYKRDTVNDIETELTLPSSTMQCQGQALHYHSGRDSLIFIMIQNGLYSIAEYKNP